MPGKGKIKNQRYEDLMEMMRDLENGRTDGKHVKFHDTEDMDAANGITHKSGTHMSRIVKDYDHEELVAEGSNASEE